VTPPRNDASSSAVTRGRRCGSGGGGNHFNMMSGGDVIVTSSIDENSEFVEADPENVLNEIIVSNSLVIHLHTHAVCWFHSVNVRECTE